MSDGINGSLSDRADARREAAEREQAHAKGEHAPGCHQAWGMCECGLAERLSAENADLRARLEQAERERDEAREEMKEAAGELLIPLPQSDPTVRKLLLANSIMRQERDAARAELERAQAEAAAMREALAEAQSRLRRPIKLIRDDGFNAAMEAITTALSASAGADLLAELAKLREVERLGKEYADAVLARRDHRGVSVEDFANAAYDKVVGAEGPLAWRAAGEASKDAIHEWSEIDKRLAAAKRAAGEALFAALGKEAAE